ncbi:hypothetical protein [Peribacillus sp. V2I11]|uniref:hypothetical protein n=1 Tax=Peribacillus sp. V2I11 TaxID=3042277 RepID=UPI00277DBBC2|nr:hypothetical protein [Peribacillus sp. V2I11]MCM3673546.1 hypothetical protein [Peribacillus simplex]MDQ0882769.1 hypothetical protein [Peribacillus sp. V2I11]
MSVSRILNYALYLYVLLYALIYFIYISFINAVHASDQFNEYISTAASICSFTILSMDFM